MNHINKKTIKEALLSFVVIYFFTLLLFYFNTESVVSKLFIPAVNSSLKESLFVKNGKFKASEVKGVIYGLNRKTHFMVTKGFFPFQIQDIRIIEFSELNNLSKNKSSVMAFNLEYFLLKGGVSRGLTVQIIITLNYLWILLCFILSIVMTSIINKLFPKALEGAQIDIFDSLIENSVDQNAALMQSHKINPDAEYTALHFEVLDVVLQRNVEDFDIEYLFNTVSQIKNIKIDLFKETYSFGLDLEKALRLSSHALELKIEGNQNDVYLNGVHLKLTRTLFAYYLFYIRARLGQISSDTISDEGWIPSPPQNKPSEEYTNVIERIFDEHGCHAKADSNDDGISEKNLRDKRSKIKKEILKVIPESLSDNFLFEERKNKLGRKDFRLKLEPKNIFLE